MEDQQEPSTWNHASDGYPAVAEFISRDPDNETYIFRKFDRLTARTLLYQQAELASLEAELARLDRRIAQQHDIDLDLCMRSWEEMQRAPNDEISELIGLTQKIEEKLRNYHEALLRKSAIAKLEPPCGRVLSALRTELHGRPKIPNALSKLGAADREILEEKSDLVALRPPAYKDSLSRMVREWWPSSRSSIQASDTWHFEERWVVWVVGIISTTVATILLIGSIISLYFVTNPDIRLGLVLTFVVFFATSLSICTGASRDSIFTATAAYSAVLVVFVSGNLGNANTPTSPVAAR